MSVFAPKQKDRLAFLYPCAASFLDSPCTRGAGLMSLERASGSVRRRMVSGGDGVNGLLLAQEREGDGPAGPPFFCSAGCALALEWAG